MKSKKVLSAFLAFLMVFSLLSSAYAASAEKQGTEEKAGKSADASEAARKAAFAQAMKEQDIPEMIKNMSVEEKIAQTFMMDFRSREDENGVNGLEELPEGLSELLRKYRFGSVILFAPNFRSTEQVFQLTKDMQEAATADGGIPLLIATDQEGGIVYRMGQGTSMPGNMAIAAAGNIEDAEKAGGIIGRELSAVGINTNLAPVADVNSNASNPIIGVRSFSDDPAMVSQFAAAEIKGLSESGVITCAKHFPGHGNTDVDSHTGLPMVDKSLDELEATELVPFRKAIDSGVDMIMTAHILYPQIDDTTVFSEKLETEVNRPATLSEKIITGLLKKEMHFSGVVLSDDLGMGGISNQFDTAQAAAEVLKAGVDMICFTQFGRYKETESEQMIDSLLASLKEELLSEKEGSLSMERLDDAVMRILTLKKNKGLLEYDPEARTVQAAFDTLRCEEHISFEREAAARGITVIKNNNILPYRAEENARVLMLCPKADVNPLAVPMLIGWNRAKAAGLIPESAEVGYYVFSDEDHELEGDLKDAVDKADTVILCSKIGGSKDAMAYRDWMSACPREITDYCAQNGKKSIVLSVSNPYDVQLYPKADAVLAAYGYIGSHADPEKIMTEGITDTGEAAGPNVIAGVEVIFGVFGASGKLPVAIPRFDEETELFDTSDIVCPRGYGLTYSALLPEEEQPLDKAA